MRASTLAVSTRPCLSPRNFNKTGPGDEASCGAEASFMYTALPTLLVIISVMVKVDLCDGLSLLVRSYVGRGYPLL